MSILSAVTAVFVSSDVDYDYRLDDEVEVFHVYVGDDDAEPVGKTYTCRSRDRAISLAEDISRDRGGLEVVVE